MKKSADAVHKCIEQRVADFVQKPVDHLEPLQVVWYRHGQEYKPHMDYFPKWLEGSEEQLKRGGQRLATLFAYLNNVPPQHGGHTIFPIMKLEVPAVKNDAAFWYDVKPDGMDDERTLHGGAPVQHCEKWGMNVWVRQEVFV